MKFAIVIVCALALSGCAFLDKMTPDQTEQVATTVESAGAAAPLVGAAGGPAGVVVGSAIGGALIAFAAYIRSRQNKGTNGGGKNAK